MNLPHRAAAFLLIPMFSSWLAVVAQSQQPPITLDLTIRPEVVMAGTSVKLDAALTNHSNTEMVFDLSFACGFDLSLEIDIRDSKGNQPPQTGLFRRAKGEDIGPDSRTPEGEFHGHTIDCLRNSGRHGIMPHEGFRSIVDLDRMYDLSQPGKYTVQARRVDINNNAVQSDPIAFTVLPNPDYTPEVPCTTTALVTVTLNDPSGAAIPNAIVVFRPEGKGSNEPPRSQQLTTNSAGIAVTRAECGFVDVFVGAYGFTPYANKTDLGHAEVPLKIMLYAWPQPNPGQ